jgi:thiamine monophosphate kinase
LCFTAPKAKRTVVDDIFKKLSLNGAVIGEITAATTLTIIDESGHELPMPKSFDHFIE